MFNNIVKLQLQNTEILYKHVNKTELTKLTFYAVKTYNV